VEAGDCNTVIISPATCERVPELTCTFQVKTLAHAGSVDEKERIFIYVAPTRRKKNSCCMVVSD